MYKPKDMVCHWSEHMSGKSVYAYSEFKKYAYSEFKKYVEQGDRKSVV